MIKAMVKQKFFSGFFLFLFSVFLFSPDRAEAATCAWIGGTGTNASTAANWSDCGGQAPQSTDDVVINATSDEISWDASAGSTVASLTLGASFTGTTTLNRALTVSGDIAVNGGALNTGTQNLTVQGGDFTVASGKTATSSSSGTVTMQGTGTLGGAGIMTLANLTIGNSATLSASTTLGGNVSVSGNCSVLGASFAASSLSVIFGLDSNSFECLGILKISSNQSAGEGVTFTAQSGSLSVFATTTIQNNSILGGSSVVFDGGVADLSFNGELAIESVGSLPGAGEEFYSIFNAGSSGSMTVMGSTTVRTGGEGYYQNNFAIFNGMNKSISFSGSAQITSLGSSNNSYNGTYFNAGTSASTTFSSNVLIETTSSVATASTTFNGQAKNLRFDGNLTVGTHGATAGDVVFIPSTGNTVIYGDLLMIDSDSSLSGASAYLSSPLNSYNLSLAGNLTVTDGDGSGSALFLPSIGTTTFVGSGAQEVSLPSGSGLFNVLINNSASSTVTFGASASTTNLFITKGTLISGSNTIEVDGYYKNTAGAGGTTWTGGTLYLNGKSQTLSGTDTYNVLQIGANTDIRMNGSSASTYTVDSTGSLYSTDHAGTDGELYIWGDYHVPTSGTVGSSSYSSDFWSYATDFDGTSLSSGSERQVKVYIASGATINVENVAEVGPKRLKIIGTASYPTLITRQGASGYYTFKINKGRLHANYFHFDYLDSSGLQITNAAVIPQFDNGVFDNGQSGGSFITISAATTTLVADSITFNNAGSAATYNITASGGVNWRFKNSTGTFDGDSYDNPSGGASLLWEDDAVSTTTPTVLSSSSIKWNFTDNSGSEKAFALFGTDGEYKLSPSVIHQFATGTVTLGFIGDSLTSGVTGFTNASDSSDYMSDNGTDGYPSQIKTALNNVLGTTTSYHNGAIGGWSAGDWVYTISGGSFAPFTFSSFYTNALSSLGENPDIVLILLGTNDAASVSAATYKTYLADIVSNVISNGGIPFISYVPPYYSDDSSGIEVYESEIASYNSKIIELAEETGAYLGPDIYSAMQNYTASLGQNSMYSGEVHFQELGFSAIANEWIPILMLTGGNSAATANISYLTETGLTPNTEYQRVIYPMNASGLGVGATTSAVYTLAAIPAGGAVSRSGSTASVSWSSNGNPVGTEYFVTNTTNGSTSGWITETSADLNAETGENTFTIKARNAEDVETSNLTINLEASGGGGVPILFGTNIPIYIPSSSQTSSSSSLSFSNPSSETTSQNENTASLSLAKLAGPFSFGQTSEQVRLLQEYLSRDKTIYPEGKITGYYGPLTRAAVGKFQERYGLAKASDDFYGLAGPKTREKIASIFGTSGNNNELNQATLALIESLKKQIAILVAQVAELIKKENAKKLCADPDIFVPCFS